MRNDTLVPLSKTHGRKYTKGMLQSIDWAGELDYQRRPANVDVFLESLIETQNAAQTKSYRGWFG